MSIETLLSKFDSILTDAYGLCGSDIEASVIDVIVQLKNASFSFNNDHNTHL